MAFTKPTTYLLLLLSGLAFWGSCGKKQPAVEPQPQQQAQLPTLPRDSVLLLLDKVENVDVIFLQRDYSANFGGGMAKFQLASIGEQSVSLGGCEEICRLDVNGNGELLAHLGVFLGPDCGYYVFYEDNRPQYANNMREEGRNMFSQILQRARTQ